MEGRRERSRAEGEKQGWKKGQREERADSRATCSGRERLRGTDGSRDRGRGFCVRRGLVQRARGATCAGEPKRTGSTLTCDDIAIMIIMI